MKPLKTLMQMMSILPRSEEPGPPHEALFLVLNYLPLYELLVMSEVCMSLKDAVNNDVLQCLVVEEPLSWRLSDQILMRLASKVNGRLRTLTLINCMMITDSAFQQVIENNPLINKLHIPGCSDLTPQVVIRAVEMLSKQNHTLKSLFVNGIYNINKEHLETLHSYLKLNSAQQQPLLYHQYRNIRSLSLISDRTIDVEICPRCNQVRLVFDCPKEMCNQKKSKRFQGSCKGCYFCIPRCAECGGCTESEEVEETICMHLLCSGCSLQLPKCYFCNRPYCRQHANLQNVSSGSSGFLCNVCGEKLQYYHSMDQ